MSGPINLETFCGTVSRTMASVVRSLPTRSGISARREDQS